MDVCIGAIGDRGRDRCRPVDLAAHLFLLALHGRTAVLAPACPVIPTGEPQEDDPRTDVLRRDDCPADALPADGCRADDFLVGGSQVAIARKARSATAASFAPATAVAAIVRFRRALASQARPDFVAAKFVRVAAGTPAACSTAASSRPAGGAPCIAAVGHRSMAAATALLRPSARKASERHRSTMQRVPHDPAAAAPRGQPVRARDSPKHRVRDTKADSDNAHPNMRAAKTQ